MTDFRRHLSGAALAFGLAVTLAGCGAQRSHGEQAQYDACRARAEQVYSVQNRGDVYQDDAIAGGGRDTPFAGPSLYAASNDALGGRYAREQMIDRCVRGSAGNVGSTLDGVDPTQGDAPASPDTGASHRPAPNPLAAPPSL